MGGVLILKHHMVGGCFVDHGVEPLLLGIVVLIPFAPVTPRFLVDEGPLVRWCAAAAARLCFIQWLAQVRAG